MNTNMKKIIRAVLSVFFVWLAVSFGLYLMSGKIVHKTVLSHGQKFNVPYERTFVRNAAGSKIDIMWAPWKDGGDHKTYLYLHGNAGRLPFIVEGLAREGNLLSPAYPGYSASDGSPNTKNVNETVDLSIEFLHAHGIQDRDIVVVGHSLGGSPAVYAAVKYPDLGKVILVNTFYSIQEMCESRYYIFCVFSGGIHNTAAIAPMTKVAIRQFHDRNDNVVPFEQGEALFKLLGSPDKRFTVLSGGHSDFDVKKILE